MLITKIGLKIRKLWPFKIGTNFQTQTTIVIVGNRLKKGIGRKVAIFPIVIMKNILKSMIVIVNLLGEKLDSL